MAQSIEQVNKALVKVIGRELKGGVDQAVATVQQAAPPIAATAAVGAAGNAFSPTLFSGIGARGGAGVTGTQAGSILTKVGTKVAEKAGKNIIGSALAVVTGLVIVSQLRGIFTDKQASMAMDIAFYKERLIEESELRSRLKKEDFSEDDIDLIVAQANLDIARKDIAEAETAAGVVAAGRQGLVQAPGESREAFSGRGTQASIRSQQAAQESAQLERTNVAAATEPLRQRSNAFKDQGIFDFTTAENMGLGAEFRALQFEIETAPRLAAQPATAEQPPAVKPTPAEEAAQASMLQNFTPAPVSSQLSTAAPLGPDGKPLPPRRRKK